MDKSKLKAILFDMDGVLVDSEPLHFAAHKKALENFGMHLTVEDYMEFGVAKGDANLYEKAAQKFNVIIDKQKISKLKKKAYRELFDEKAALMPGMRDMLRELEKKYVLAIVSSGAADIVRHVVGKLGIEKYFHLIVTGDDVEKVKPHPDVYLKAIDVLGFAKGEYIAVEDSKTGVEAAKAADIKCIAIPNGFTKSQDFSKADMILSNVSELKEMLA